MKMTRTLFTLGLALMLVGCQTNRVDSSAALLGVWEPTTYVIDGTDHPLDGLMIITPRYFVANTTFESSTDGVSANANSGPYYLEDGHIVLNQWMQLHYRPQNEAENFLKAEVVEKIRYTLKADTLTFLFPSGNQYISRRLKNDSAAKGPEDLKPAVAR